MNNDELAISRRKNCGFVFQQIYLLDRMSLLDNVLTSELLTNKNKKEVVKKAKELFASSIIINFNISNDYDEYYDKLDTASNFFTIPSTQYTNELLNDIKNIKTVENAEIQNGVMLNVPVKMEDSIQEQNQVFYNINNVSKLNKKEIIKETADKVENGIYLSNYTFIHFFI